MRNPKWTRDELILALDLYFQINPARTNADNAKIIELSALLNRLASCVEKGDITTYRNPNGVYMKLCNFLRFDPAYDGVGLRQGGKLEGTIWSEFAPNRDNLHAVAEAIRAAVQIPAVSVDDESIEDEEAFFPEGKLLFRRHRSFERNAKAIAKVKKQALEKDGKLICTVCGFDFFAVYGKIGEGYIECHHIVPVSDYVTLKRTVTKANDLTLVCANCHRMLHRRRPWLSIESLKELLERK